MVFSRCRIDAGVRVVLCSQKVEKWKMLVKEQIVQKLDHLPEPRLQEVLSFVEYLIEKTNDPWDDPILSVAGILSGRAMSADEIERALYGDEETE
jgi:hypothetical protein